MTATTLAGRRALDELTARYGEYEAGLALGFSERDAVLEACRPAAGQALVPALDQTRTVGLVTLPGAFVGGTAGRGEPGGGRGALGRTTTWVSVGMRPAKGTFRALDLGNRGIKSRHADWVTTSGERGGQRPRLDLRGRLSGAWLGVALGMGINVLRVCCTDR
ncbi:ABC transporter permease [Micromonospora sp. ATCC 39149]|uniref:ABC transporter permease n=1 Tax=Micromonospora sp. (strain ATCC 39149 / NRRL 15099 / SCC 1413) TaxID=219305 RepID=UPI001E49FB3D|nr:ABC transporter permease [Micromonospora sp. ATCC 39149]